VSPVRYELGFYIPEDDIPHSLCHENLKSYKEDDGSQDESIRANLILISKHWAWLWRIHYSTPLQQHQTSLILKFVLFYAKLVI
jgi:hypothetical protein